MAAVLALGALAGCGGSDDDPAGTTSSTTEAPVEGTVIEVTVTGGEVEGGLERAEVQVGEPVTVRVTSDTADELHVHGYDLKADLTPGEPAEISFTADLPGVWEIELEQAGLPVAELQVV